MLMQTKKDVTLNTASDEFRLVDADGDNPASASDRAVAVLEDSGEAGDELTGIYFGQVQIECTDTAVTAGDQLVADGSGNGTVVADSGTTDDVVVAIALEGCDTSGQFIECLFIPVATPNA